MKRNISLQFKAAFLLAVFSLNTVIGFACAMGVDMGFNRHHHHHDEEEATETTVHFHADGKKHQHVDEAAKHHHDSNEDSEKGGCCNDGVIKFQSLDKNLNSNSNTSISQPVFVAVITNFYITDIFRYTKAPAQRYLLPYFHPPPPDIRILIQSFQI